MDDAAKDASHLCRLSRASNIDLVKRSIPA
jgi:hypothetical protein